MPRIALTATADERTREEIVAELSLEDAATLHRQLRPAEHPLHHRRDGHRSSARERLWQFIETEHPTDAGIVYCLSRKSVEETAAWLTAKGRKALAYHAGLDAHDARRARRTNS